MAVLASVVAPTEGLRYQLSDVLVYVNSTNLGKGTIYITDSNFIWQGPGDSGFSLTYPKIGLHGVSRDLSVFPQECLYLLVDEEIAIGEPRIEESNEISNEELAMGADPPTPCTEVKLFPDDKSVLDALYSMLTVAQNMHPDAVNITSDDYFFVDADEDSDMDETDVDETDVQLARLRLEHSANNGTTPHSGVGSLKEKDVKDDMDPDCFEDADNELPEN